MGYMLLVGHIKLRQAGLPITTTSGAEEEEEVASVASLPVAGEIEDAAFLWESERNAGSIRPGAIARVQDADAAQDEEAEVAEPSSRSCAVM